MTIRRIIIDANVWIRFARFKNLTPLLDRFDKYSLVPVVNRYLLSEIFDALVKKNWISSKNAMTVINLIENVSILTPGIATFRMSPDPKDNYLIDLAVQTNCALIISDDAILLSLPLLPVPVKTCNWFMSKFPV